MFWWTRWKLSRQLRTSDDEHSVRTAISRLAESGDPRAVMSLVGALGRSRFRTDAAEGIVRLGTVAIEPLIATLDDYCVSTDDKSLVVRILGRIGGYDVVDPLIKILEHAVLESIRVAAAEALGAIGHERCIGPLGKVLSSCGNRSVITAAALALGTIPSPRAVDQLLECLHKAKGLMDMKLGGVFSADASHAFWEARRALERQGPLAVKRLLEVANDPRASLRIVAARELTTARDGRVLAAESFDVERRIMCAVVMQDFDALIAAGAPAIKSLLEMFRNPDASIGGKAIDALVCIGRCATLKLCAALKDPNQMVRLRSIQVLARLKDPDALAPLIGALRDSDKNVRAQAADALRKLGDVGAVEALMTATGDEAGIVRAWSVSALEEIGDDRVVKALLPLCKDPDSAVRLAVASALGKLGDRRATEPLVSLLDDSDGSVCSTAASALGTLQDPKAVKPLASVLYGERKFSWRKYKESTWGSFVPEGDVINSAAQALMKLDSAGMNVLVAALEHESKYVGAAAGTALRSLLGGSWKPTPRQYLLITIAGIDYGSTPAQIFANMGNEHAVKEFAALIKDKNVLVRRTTADTLAKITDTGTIAPLAALLADDDSTVRAIASNALAHIRDERAKVALVSCVETVVRDGNFEIAKLLGHNSIRALTAAFLDPSFQRRWAALLVLASISLADAIGPLISVAKVDPYMAEYAIELLEWELQYHAPEVRTEDLESMTRLREITTKRVYRIDRDSDWDPGVEYEWAEDLPAVPVDCSRLRQAAGHELDRRMQGREWKAPECLIRCRAPRLEPPQR